MHKSLLSLAALSLLLAACDDPAEQQLESFGLAVTTDDEEAGMPWYEATAQGQATVSGSGRDQTLTVQGADESLEVAVHTPGSSDLRIFDGGEVQVDVSGSSLVVSDDDGVVYVGDDGNRRWDLEDEFGVGFVDFGSTIRAVADGAQVTTYKNVRFQTDEGEVELAPGEIDTVTLGGVDYRVTVIAAYEVEELLPFVAMCGGTPDTLSYEMLRVEQRAEPTIVRRPEGLPMAQTSGLCG